MYVYIYIFILYLYRKPPCNNQPICWLWHVRIAVKVYDVQSYQSSKGGAFS